jgi:hypothetical protein
VKGGVVVFSHLYTVGEVRTACADVRAKDVGPIALVVDADRADLGGVTQVLSGAKDVDRLPPDGREKDVEVGAGNELWKHASSLFKHAPPQRSLADAEPVEQEQQ